MKAENMISKKLLVLPTIFALIFLSLSLVSAVTLAEWNFDSESLNPSIIITPSASLSVNTNPTPTITYSAGNPSTGKSLSSNNWNIGDNFEIRIDTTNYKDLILKFDEQVSSTGPAQFKVQYSSDGTTFTDLTGSIKSTSTVFGTNPMQTFNLSGISAINNNVNTKMRIIVLSDASDMVGTWRIDNLKIEGTVSQPQDEFNYCDLTDNQGDLKVDIRDINVKEGFADKDDEWYPLDEIEVKIRVENNGDWDIDNVEVEWCLYDTKNKDCVIDDTEKDFDLRSDRDETITITFQVDPDDLESDVEDYIFYAKATGEINDKDSTYDGDDSCISDSKDVQMIIERDFVVLNNLKTTPETVQCSGEVEITADVWNIGDDDQRDVVVLIYNRELGISEEIEIGDIDSFDNEKLNFNFEIPKDAQEKTYKVEVKVLDEDGDIYENDNNDESLFIAQVKVEGGCGVSGESQISISANLVSGGKAGEELVIKATATNKGTKSITLTAKASGYESWAQLNTINPTVIILNAGQSKDVLFTFNVNPEASGDKTFNIGLTGDSESINQPVSVTIEPSASGGLGRITGGFGGIISGSNWYLWAIGALNIILVIIIIVVAVRVARS